MGTATILVVDDERKIRDLLRSYLEREGYAVLVADTGQRALEAIERARPDLVVLVARVEAVLRRARGGARAGLLSSNGGALVIDPEAREVRLDGEPV